MKPTKHFIRGWGFAVVFILIATLLGSCKYELVKDPTHNFNEKKNAADYTDYILPPKTVTASHGLSHTVNLVWETVPNAVQYYIYSAATPYDTFQKVSETKANETEISIDEETGITKYYCVCAVNYYGTISSKSIVVSGSTLSVPIITEITASEEGDSVTVHWWMDNCNTKTYESLIYYNISVFANAFSTKPFAAITTPGDKRSIKIPGLEPKTEYFFTIEVVNKETSDKEISTKTSAETAHRIIPDAPKDLTITQGDSIDKITISWTLPEKAWYRTNEGASGFELHPLYFEIYRKENSETSYTKIGTISYLVTNNNITTDSYTPGATETFIQQNTEVERGKQYNYYVQSFTDGVSAAKQITADASKSQTVTGWLLSNSKLSISSEYEEVPKTDGSQGTEYKSVAFMPHLSFESFGVNYKYILVREKASFDAPDTLGSPEVIEIFNSQNALNSYTDSFNNPSVDGGYYYYTLFICASDATKDNYSSLKFDTVKASGKYTVTDDPSKVPTIERFSVKDGYKNKFALTWKYNSEYVYTVHWIDEKTGDEYEYELTETDLTGAVSGEDFSYNHEAVSGDSRIYSLEASCGLSTQVKANEEDISYKTLGTADPKITSYEYDKLCVEWPAVQMAPDTPAAYTVSAKYEGEQTELSTAQSCTIENQGDVYKCVITKPQGYNNALKSGKPINLTVTASSGADGVSDTTTCEPLTVRTVGPALTGVQVDYIKQSDRIDIQWNPVEGANGYLIRRIVYKTADMTEQALNTYEVTAASCDVYYYDMNSVSLNGETVGADRVQITTVQNKFKLTDIYKKASDSTSSYEMNQACIKWGIPYGYVVIPVKKGGSKDDFVFAERTIMNDQQEPVYADIGDQERYRSTFGFGLCVHSQKSESTDTQIIEWNVPYNYSSEDSYSVYCREAGSTSNVWNIVNVLPAGDVSNGIMTASYKPADKVKAYEYLVAYNTDESTLTNTVPDSFISDDKIGLSAMDNSAAYDAMPAERREKFNKGYLLYVNNLSAQGAGNSNKTDYSERVSWSNWNYNERSIGPDEAYVAIRNYNISSEWIRIAKLDGNLHFNQDICETSYNTTVERSNNNISCKVSPVTMMQGTSAMPVTKGCLMVLRDAKHYYSLELVRNNTSYRIENNNNNLPVYAYRNISEKELVKCALLNMAYGFYLDGGGTADYSNAGSKLGYKKDTITLSGDNGNGSASFGDRHLLGISEAGKYKAEVSMSSFAPNQLNPGGTKTCVVKISMSGVSTRTQGLSDPYLDKFRTENFTVTVEKIDSQMPDTYSGTLTMSCTDDKTLTVKIGTTTVAGTSNVTARSIYFPMQIAEDNKWYFLNVNSGWWVE